MSEALTALAALRESGADRVDPVRFHFLEALAQRAQAQPVAVAVALEQKLSALLTAYHARCQQAEKAAKATAKKKAKKMADQASSPLSELLAHITASTLASEPAAALEIAANEGVVGEVAQRAQNAPAELKALRYFREDWSKLSTEQVVTQSLASAPENAGPLNSHMLVLKAIEVMRGTAPAYLANFITYIDSLLWLEQAVASLPAKKPATVEGEKKRKTTRTRKTAP